MAPRLPQLDLTQSQPIPGAGATELPQLDLSRSQPVNGAPPIQAAASGTVPAAPSAWDRFSTAFEKGVGIAPPQNVTEHVIDTLTGNTGGGLLAYRVARSVVDSVDRAMKSKGAGEFEQAKQDVQQAVADFHNRDYRNLASSAGSVAGDLISGAGGPIASQAGNRVRSISEGARPGGDLASPLGATAADATNLAVTAGVGGMGSAEAAPEEAATADEAGTVQKIKQAVSPKAATQPGAQSTFREGAATSAKDAGITGAVDTSGSIRAIMDKPIEAAAKVESGLYKTLNDAAETDMKDLFDRREELMDALDDPTNVANRRALADELSVTEKAIKVHSDLAADKLGVDGAADLLDQAKAATQQRYSMEEGQKKLFNNESVVSGNTAHGAPESINVNSAIKAAENLDKPSKFAPTGSPTRLEQMFGEDGAKAFKQGLYDAQKAGQKVATRNQIIKWAGITGVPVVGGTYELLKH